MGKPIDELDKWIHEHETIFYTQFAVICLLIGGICFFTEWWRIKELQIIVGADFRGLLLFGAEPRQGQNRQREDDRYDRIHDDPSFNQGRE